MSRATINNKKLRLLFSCFGPRAFIISPAAAAPFVPIISVPAGKNNNLLRHGKK
jgi:fructose-1,6-bisphosphatase